MSVCLSVCLSFVFFSLSLYLSANHSHSGPQSILAIHNHCPDLKLDAHVVTRTPRFLILPLRDAGISRFTFQFEIARDELINTSLMMGNKEDNNKMNRDKMVEVEVEAEVEREAVDGKENEDSGEVVQEIEVDKRGGVIGTALSIRQAGMLCGVCIAPHTHVKELTTLLQTWYQPHTGCILHSKGTYVTNVNS